MINALDKLILTVLLLCAVVMPQQRTDNATADVTGTEMNSSIIINDTDDDNISVTNTTDNSNETLTNITDDTQTTTALPETTTLQPDHVTEYATLREKQLALQDYCTCDLTANSCDINCCCDAECSEVDRQAFSQCLSRAQQYADQRHCVQENILFANNTEYKTVRISNGLLCILTDNLGDSNIFPSLKAVEDYEEFVKYTITAKYFSWFEQYLTADRATEQRSNVHKSPVIVIKEDGSAFEFELPSSFTSPTCDRSEKILYLVDYFAECEVDVQTLPADCKGDPVLNAATFLKLTFLGGVIPKESPEETSTTATTSSTATTATTEASPDDVKTTTTNVTINSTVSEPKGNKTETIPEATTSPLLQEKKLEISLQKGTSPTSYHLVPMTVLLCDASSGPIDNCIEEAIPPLCCKSGRCDNVLQEIQFLIIHNGTAGIQEAIAQVYLTSIRESDIIFWQTFKVNYQWINDNESQIFYRSGRPGYITGKPILLGQLVANDSSEDPQSWIELEKDPGNWLTVLTPTMDSFCYKRMPVQFNVNIRTGCTVSIPKEDIRNNCLKLRQHLLIILLGPILQKIDDVKIGMFGDSNINHPQEWISVLFEDAIRNVLLNEQENAEPAESCDNVITSIEIRITFAYQGPFGNPQAKVIGAVVKHGHTQDLRAGCKESLLCSRFYDNQSQTVSTELSSSVLFIDISKAAERQYPKAPAFDISLPYDFFYPFLPSAGQSYRCDSTFEYYFSVLIVLILMSFVQ